MHHPLTLHSTGANQTDSNRKAWIRHFGAYGWFRRRLHPKALAIRLSAALGFGAGVGSRSQVERSGR